MSTIEDGPLHSVMGRVGRLSTRRPWLTVTVWLLVAVGVGALVLAFGRATDENAALPGATSQHGRDLLESHFAGAQDATGQVLFRSPGTALDTASVAAAAQRVAAVGHVSGVQKPVLSADRRTGYVDVQFDLGPRDVTPELIDDVLAAAATDGVETLPAGALARPRSDTRLSEALGIVVALVVLVIAFGGLLAATLPLLTAVVTLVCGVGIIGLAGHLTGIPSVATTLGTMIGLGVGIDYALFLMTRYRALLPASAPAALASPAAPAGPAAPASPAAQVGSAPGSRRAWRRGGSRRGGTQVIPVARRRAAVVETVASSGSAVAFAGGTVIVALGGLAVAGVPILATLGWTAGLVVLVAVASATTLLPAMLMLLGGRVTAPPVRDRASLWGRLADRVTRRPWRYAVTSAVLLLALAAPVTAMTLGQTDAGDDPAGTDTRAGYDAMAAAFGAGVNGPLTVVAALDSPASSPADARLAQLSAAVGGTAGIASVQPVRLSADGTVASIKAVPTTAPSDPATRTTVDRLDDLRVGGVAVSVTGQTAIRGELADRVGARMPFVIGLVVLLSALLVFAAFRAPVVAAKAALMNLLSVGAAYGVLTAVFQWGWGVTWTGLDGPVPIEAYVPMMLFALLSGLSMDYEVFLLTAVRESWVRTGDNVRAVRDGLAGTGVVITSAALIMVCVFASFVLSSTPVVKMIGLGLAVAIAVDATVIRGLLVPATMALLGRANWWSPRRRSAAAPRSPELETTGPASR
ncbi:MMPL family transporter [Paractinoplanes ferrugineus]|uniref:Membrane protein n=1 Tax=Paractinoplanes ferrugineus TaxID=113564 RepID=A0A919J796_9ACTN|nr:MMPL family transporter [Actinoplanes ferrugineus]GIE16151.1 membrane protein [Actinoplanes ferrugineus]